MYEIDERVRYHNGGTMEGLCEARLKKQGRLSSYISMVLNSEKLILVCGRAVISR